MFKITKSLLLIAAIAFIAVGATKSYFTDTESIAANEITTGTLDMTIGENSFEPISVNNIKPGDTIVKNVLIQNSGSLDFGSLKMSIDNTNDPSELLDQLNISTRVLIAEVAYVSANTAASDTQDLDVLEGYTLSARESCLVEVTISVPAELGNDFQNIGASFDLVFNAEQVI